MRVTHFSKKASAYLVWRKITTTCAQRIHVSLTHRAQSSGSWKCHSIPRWTAWTNRWWCQEIGTSRRSTQFLLSQSILIVLAFALFPAVTQIGGAFLRVKIRSLFSKSVSEIIHGWNFGMFSTISTSFLLCEHWSNHSFWSRMTFLTLRVTNVCVNIGQITLFDRGWLFWPYGTITYIRL